MRSVALRRIAPNSASDYPVLLERIGALPGVRSVGYARAFGNVLDDGVGRMPIGVVGTQESDFTAQLDVVSPGFFETVGIPILQGRGPRWSDTPETPPVAFVSASLARALGGDVIGKRVWFGSLPQFGNVEIVGVVGDASLGNLRSPERMGAALAMPVAVLAALLAFVGVYSLFAYAVVRRTREIGVRLAVGASPGAVLRMVLRESVTLTAIGVALGIPISIITSQGLRALLFGVSESDPAVALSTVGLFLALTIAAALIPARRAARLDPVAALRAE